MSKVKVAAFSVSLDGYGAGPDQSLEHPLGRGGEQLHEWLYPTKKSEEMAGQQNGAVGADNDFAESSFENVGVWIMGRNMFGPIRGPWPDDDWKGWWGSTPPFHVPVFVLTHHRRESVRMEGGTVFHFVSGTVQSVLELARQASNGKDIRIGGGVSTIRQFLQAGLIDEMHLAFTPFFLGSGERFFDGIDLPALGFRETKIVYGMNSTHVVLKREG